MSIRGEWLDLSCHGCGISFQRPIYRVRELHRTFCSRACLGQFRRDRHERTCEHCSKTFWVQQWRTGRIDRFCTRSCASQFKKTLPVRRRVAARNGDQRQATRSIRDMIRRGFLAHPSKIACVDCGHVCTKGGRRHEYDHHIGYETAEQHEAVEVVCSQCHKRRTNERQLQAAFVAGWLIGLQGQLTVAQKWLDWVNKS